MEMRHTPGPWKSVQDHGPWTAVLDKMQFTAHLPPQSRPWMVLIGTASKGIRVLEVGKEADARLVSAAPELLEAAKMALENLRSWNLIGIPVDKAKTHAHAYELSPEITALKDAIAKAEGKSHV